MPNNEMPLAPAINPAHLHEDIKTLCKKIKQLNNYREAASIKNVHIFFDAKMPDGSDHFCELTQNQLPFNLPQEILVILDQSIDFYCRQLNTYQQLLLQIKN